MPTLLQMYVNFHSIISIYNTLQLKRVMINHIAHVRLFTFLLRCGPEAAIFVARKWRQLLRKVTEKRKQKRALHCG
jgi:flavorubredoxin